VSVCLRSALLTEAGFRHGFSLRTGGTSEGAFASLNLARNVGDENEAVRENHARLAQAVGYAPERLFEVSQVHGARVEYADPGSDSSAFRMREADAIIATEPGLPVAVRVADCVPVLLAHPGSGAVAAVHAGWRGVVAGVLLAAVSELSHRTGAAAGEWIAALGPHIGPEAFEVGEEVARQIADSAGDEAGVILPRSPRPHVDLARAVRAQLVHAGLAAAHVDTVAGCTFLEPSRFFSFRRDGKRSGRHLAVIVSGC
jgi:polyphenol oxidase